MLMVHLDMLGSKSGARTHTTQWDIKFLLSPSYYSTHKRGSSNAVVLPRVSSQCVQDCCGYLMASRGVDATREQWRMSQTDRLTDVLQMLKYGLNTSQVRMGEVR